MSRIDEQARKTNICFDCKKACGGCSWSEIDPNTEKPRFEPVEGWTAKKTSLLFSNGHGDLRREITYHITACPLFERDEPRVSSGSGISLEQMEVMLMRWRREGDA